MGFFDNASTRWATQAGDLSQQSYAAQQKQLEYRKALAQMMLNQQMPQGQMVGRQYVAPSAGASIATGLQQILGMYLSGRNSQAEGDLESKDKALRQAALKGMFAPQPDAPTTETVRNQVVAAKDNEYRDMNASEMQRMQARLLAGGPPDGATPVGPEGAQSFPVAPQSDIRSQLLPPTLQAGAGRGMVTPPLVSQPQAVVPPAPPTVKPEIALKQARAELLQDPAAAGLSVGEFNTRVQQRANQIAGVADRSAVALAAAHRAAASAPPPVPVNDQPEPAAPVLPEAAVRPRLSYEDVLASQAVADGSAQAAATEQKQKFIDALKARSQAQQDSLLALGNGSDRSEKLQMALLERQSKAPVKTAVVKAGEKLIDEATGKVVYDGGAKSAPEVKPSDLNTYRKREAEIRGDIERVGNLKVSADKALELSKKLNINWAGGAAWEKATSLLGVNPDYKQLEQVVTQQVLPQLTEMKGAASDRDLQTVFNTMPKPDANKAEFVRWYVDNQSKLQRAVKRLQGEYSAHQQDGESMGIAPVADEDQGSAPQGGARGMSAWLEAVGKPQGR